MNPLNISLEDRLILLSARLELSSDQQLQLFKLVREQRPCWKEVVARAEWYRVSAMLFQNLRRLGEDGLIPPERVQELKAAYVHNAARNIYLRSELHKVLQVLTEQDIPVILLKGAALLETIYESPALRFMSDIDLLVPEEKANTAQKLVCEIGYRPAGNSEVQRQTRQFHSHLPALLKENGTAVFEIHSHIVPRDSALRFDIAEFWRRAYVSFIDGVEVRLPAPEDMLVHLTVHFFLDRRFRSNGAIYQLCDIAETVRRFQAVINWETLEKQVGGPLEGPVYCGLYLARRLLQAPVPIEVLERIKPPEFDYKWEERFLKRRVLGTKRALATRLVPTHSAYSSKNLAKGMVRRLFPKQSYMAEHYGDVEIAHVSYKSYLRRLGEAGTLLAQYMRNPKDFWDEMLVDKWIHSLSYTDRNGRSNDDISPNPPKDGV